MLRTTEESWADSAIQRERGLFTTMDMLTP